MEISSSHLQFVNFVELHAYDASILDHNEGVCQLIFETHYDNLYLRQNYFIFLLYLTTATHLYCHIMH